jgi:phosphoserine phosphatase
MTALHVFDMDGTLLRETSASIELARHLGEEELLFQLEKQSFEGKLSNLEFHTHTNTLWRKLTPQLVRQVFDGSPWIGGIAQVWKDIVERGEQVIVISMSPLFFVELLRPWGAPVYASHNPIDGPVDPTRVLEAESKVTITLEIAAQARISPERIVAYGDSRSDEPLFRHVGASVAMNAIPSLETLAFASYRGEQLCEAYQLGRAQLNR